MHASLVLDRVVEDVQPTEQSMDDGPKNRLVHAPRDGDGQCRTETDAGADRCVAFGGRFPHGNMIARKSKDIGYPLHELLLN